MNSKKSVIAVLVVFVAVIALAGVAYAALGNRAQEAGQDAAQVSAPGSAATSTSSVASEASSSATASSATASSATPDMDSFDFEVESMDGQTVKLSSMKGRPTVVGFWATWCPPCNDEAPAVQALFDKYGDRVNFMMVDATDGHRETADDVRAWLDEKGYTYPVYLDTHDMQATYMYQATRLPTTVVFDANGYVVNYFAGVMSEEGMARDLDALLS